ncbi:MAG: DnaD domain protein [Alkalibacterium sp.]|nr:DnaD domain protein [Alkalibacterium sp.]TVP91570.1 MAG: DnaD domain protein [Alkalibacterium sp.]
MSQLLNKWMKAGQTSVPNILLIYYKSLGLNDKDLVVLIQLLSLVDNGQTFPDSQLLADRLDVSREEAFKAIHQLMNKKLIAIETSSDKEGKTVDEFSFDLLYEKLAYLLEEEDKIVQEKQQTISAKDVYRRFEEEFGRSLSAMEIQTISMWVDEDNYAPELIECALREAVLSQVYSLKYVDRILLSWEKKNIRTKDQVEKESRRHRENQADKELDQKSDPNEKPVPMYNWLKDKLDK